MAGQLIIQPIFQCNRVTSVMCCRFAKHNHFTCLSGHTWGTPFGGCGAYSLLNTVLTIQCRRRSFNLLTWKWNGTQIAKTNQLREDGMQGVYSVGGHTPNTAGTFLRNFRKNSGKTPETLSERFLEFRSRVRLGYPKPYNSRHLRLPEL